MIRNVVDFIGGNPYLFSNFPILIVTSLIVWRSRRRDIARAAVFSGLACIPCSLAESTSAAYWHPKLLGGMSWGIESVQFTYVLGVAAWLIAAALQRQSCSIGIRGVAGVFRRFTPGALSVIVLYILLWQAGVNCVTATLISPLGFYLYQLLDRRSLWRLSLAGLAGFVPFYFVVIRVQFALWPNYISYWNKGGWGTLVFGVPAGDLAWAALFGAVWPVAIAWALDVKFEERASVEEKGWLPAPAETVTGSPLAQPAVCAEEEQ
ncbi:MAG: hypothetical protein ABSF23_16390 [Terracidiphilus sp.]